MLIESVFFIVAAVAAGAGVLWWFRREQRLASSSITIVTILPRERLEQLFVKFIARGGRDRCAVVGDHIASQPNHLRWTLRLHFALSHEESGKPLMVADTRHGRVFFIPFPRKYPLWQVIERSEELAPRMRALIRAIRRADPDADIEVRTAMFE
jgi:hypothetical protein